MKTKHIIITAIIIGFISLIIYKRGQSDERMAARAAKKEVLDARVKELHCSNWSEIENKSKFLNYIISNSGYQVLPSENLSYKIPRLMRQAANYPSTVQYNGDDLESWISVNSKNAYNIDTLKGTWEYRFAFTAENKLSMRVKQLLILEMKYTAGCKAAQVLDIKVE